GAAFLPPGASVERGEVEPFVRFDEVDRDTAASGRISHAELEQCIHAARFGLGDSAPQEEFRAFLADRSHSVPRSCRWSEIRPRLAKKWLTRLNQDFLEGEIVDQTSRPDHRGGDEPHVAG